MNWTVIGVLLIIAALIAGIFGAGQMAGADGHFDIAIGEGAKIRAQGDQALANSQANKIDTQTAIDKANADQALSNQQTIDAGTTDSQIDAANSWNKTKKSIGIGIGVLVWLACLSIGFFLVIKFGYIQPRRAAYVAAHKPIPTETREMSSLMFPSLGYGLVVRKDEQSHTLVVSRGGVEQLEIDPHVAIAANNAKMLPAASEGLAKGSKNGGSVAQLALTTLRGLLGGAPTNPAYTESDSTDLATREE